MKYININLFSLLILFSLFVLISNTQNILAQKKCDENKTAAIDEIKRTAENSLINAKSVTKMLDSGTEIIAFYVDGNLIKISASNSLSVNEQIFFENGFPKYYDVSGYKKGKQFFFVYYLENDKILCKQDLLSGKSLKFLKVEEKKLFNNINSYMEALQ